MNHLDHSSLNNASMQSADGATHLKIVVVSLIAGMMVIGGGIAARSNFDMSTAGNSQLEARGPVIKAGKPTAFTGGEAIQIR